MNLFRLSSFVTAAAVLVAAPAQALSPENSAALQPAVLEQLIAPAGIPRLPTNDRQIGAPIAEALRGLLPDYRLSDQPLCQGARTEDSAFQFNRVKYLYTEKLTSSAEADRLPEIVELAISPIGAANAFAFPAIHEQEVEQEAPRIVLTSGLLDQLRGEGEIAFVIGHELGHLASNHLPLSLAGLVISDKQQEKISRIEQEWEFEADRFSAELLNRRGFSSQAVSSALTTLALQEHGSAGFAHPKVEERLKNLGFFIPADSIEHPNEAPHRTAAAALPLAVTGLSR